MKTDREKIYSLQVIRAIAFIGIFTSHCGTSELGAWGVSVFLVLSGFLMVYSYYNKTIVDVNYKNCLKFGIKKLKKLYPLHIVTLIGALILIIIGLIRNFSVKRIAEIVIQTLLNISLLQSWIPFESYYFSLNSVAWYLSVCLFLYISFPKILIKIKKLSNIQLVTILTITYILQVIIAFFAGNVIYISNMALKWLTYICPMYRLGDFLIGCSIGAIFVRKDRWRINSICATIVEIMSICIMIICNYIYAVQSGLLGSEYIRYSTLYTPSTVIFILIFAINKGYVSKVLTCKLLVYIGNISAYAFLIHQLVIRYMVIGLHLILKTELTPWIMTCFSFVITIGCTEIWKKIEKLSYSATNKKQTEICRL